MRRDLVVVISALAIAAFALALPAAASNYRAASPAARVLSNTFTDDSCVYLSARPHASTECVAVGNYNHVRPGKDLGQVQVARRHHWRFAGSFGSLHDVVDLTRVSCARAPGGQPRCLLVGSHFPRTGLEPLAEWGTGGRFTPVITRSPAGLVSAVLNDVSCPEPAYCVLVGSADTPAGPSVSIAYTWTDGAKLARLALPEVADASTVALSAVSCARQAACLAVGNYNTTSGKPLPYAVWLSAGTWRVSRVPPVKGFASTDIEDVSCGAPGDCIAVGAAADPGFAAVAERFRNGTWTTMRIVPEKHSQFRAISCTGGMRYCVAIGQVNNTSLIEAYQTHQVGGHLEGHWVRQAVPKLAKWPETELAGVSCLSRTDCTAVGDQNNPRVSEGFRTLAMWWNGTAWSIQPTINK